MEPPERPAAPRYVSIASICRTFGCTVPEAIQMLSPMWRHHTIATLDAMVVMDARDTFTEVTQHNKQATAAAAKAKRSVDPKSIKNAQNELGDRWPFVHEVMQVGLWLTADAAEAGE